MKKDKKVEKPAIPGAVFQLQQYGAKYKFTRPWFRIPGMNDGNPILAKDALKDEALLSYLVKNKCGVIQEVSPAKKAAETAAAKKAAEEAAAKKKAEDEAKKAAENQKGKEE